MKKIIVLLFPLFLTFAASAQSNENARDGLRGYGAPIIYIQSFHNGYGLFFGGKGAALIDDHLSIGGLGLGSYSLESFRGDDLTGNHEALLHSKAGYGGAFIAYAWPLSRSLQLNVPLQLLWGHVSVLDKENREVEKSGQVLLQPALELEFYATPGFIPSFHLGYSVAFGSNLHNLNNADFSGWSIGLEFRFAGPSR